VTRANIQQHPNLLHVPNAQLAHGLMLLVPYHPLLVNGAALASFRKMKALFPQTHVWSVPLERPNRGHHK